MTTEPDTTPPTTTAEAATTITAMQMALLSDTNQDRNSEELFRLEFHIKAMESRVKRLENKLLAELMAIKKLLLMIGIAVLVVQKLFLGL